MAKENWYMVMEILTKVNGLIIKDQEKESKDKEIKFFMKVSGLMVDSTVKALIMIYNRIS